MQHINEFGNPTLGRVQLTAAERTLLRRAADLMDTIVKARNPFGYDPDDLACDFALAADGAREIAEAGFVRDL